jgi:hypothetical protein
VSDKLNATAATVVGYRDMYFWSGRAESTDPYEIKLYYVMSRPIYDDVSAYDAFLNDNHLKRTKDLDVKKNVIYNYSEISSKKNKLIVVTELSKIKI